MMYKKTTLYLIISLAFLLANCSLTTTKTKDPVFNDAKKAEMEVIGLVTAESINVSGEETTKNEKTTSELKISIVNGQNIPTKQDERKALGKSIAAVIRGNLKDPNEFDTYQVLFILKREIGGVTKTSFVGNVFSATEL